MTPDTPQGALEDLISRVEMATGANFALECEIAQAFDAERLKEGLHAPNYTASLDAVVALVDREFPEQTNPWVVRQMLGAQWYIAEIELSEDCDGGTGEGKTPALALLLAFLRAKASEHPSRASGTTHHKSGE